MSWVVYEYLSISNGRHFMLFYCAPSGCVAYTGRLTPFCPCPLVPVPCPPIGIFCCKGFATDGEVARQLDSLLWALQRTSSSSSPWCAEDPSGKSYRLMQYNPPYTLPFRRTNAIAVRVAKGNSGDSAPDDGKESNATREEVSSTISQSSS